MATPAIAARQRKFEEEAGEAIRRIGFQPQPQLFSMTIQEVIGQLSYQELSNAIAATEDNPTLLDTTLRLMLQNNWVARGSNGGIPGLTADDDEHVTSLLAQARVTGADPDGFELDVLVAELAAVEDDMRTAWNQNRTRPLWEKMNALHRRMVSNCDDLLGDEDWPTANKVRKRMEINISIAIRTGLLLTN